MRVETVSCRNGRRAGDPAARRERSPKKREKFTVPAGECQDRTPSVTKKPLNILQVCDHLGWEGSRMHGVKRLFSWMIPRFDRERFNVSLFSLRKKDLSEETLDSLGIDITYLERGKFDPLTLPAMLRIVDAKHIDVLHLHGYGATTFGRLVGALRGIPTIVHEHANLTNTPWFQKIADRVLEPSTDIALAVSKSTADFVVHARLIPASKVKVVYLGVPLEEFSRPRAAAEIRRGARRAGNRSRRVRGRHGHAAPRVERQFVPGRRRGARRQGAAAGALLPGRRGSAAGRPAGAGRQRSVSAIDSSLPASAATSPERCRRSISACFRRSGKGRRSPRSKRWRWESRSSPPMPTVCSTSSPTIATPRSCPSATPTRSPRRSCGPSIARPSARGSARRRGSTGQQFDIDAFVRKMERLYVLLHDVSRATHRRGVLRADLSFLTSGTSA